MSQSRDIVQRLECGSPKPKIGVRISMSLPWRVGSIGTAGLLKSPIRGSGIWVRIPGSPLIKTLNYTSVAQRIERNATNVGQLWVRIPLEVFLYLLDEFL